MYVYPLFCSLFTLCASHTREKSRYLDLCVSFIKEENKGGDKRERRKEKKD